MILKDIVAELNFNGWIKRVSNELFGEKPEYLRSMFYPVYKDLLNKSRTISGKTNKKVGVREDGVLVIGDTPVRDAPIDKILLAECSRDLFDLVMWELAQSGKKWSK